MRFTDGWCSKPALHGERVNGPDRVESRHSRQLPVQAKLSGCACPLIYGARRNAKESAQGGSLSREGISGNVRLDLLVQCVPSI